MPDKDELDLLLDSALATYADPGPDDGLEQRVLLALAEAREVAGIRKAGGWPRRWLPWAIAVPVAASLLLWISIARISHVPSDQTQQAHVANPASKPSTNAPIKTADADSHQRIHSSGAKALTHAAAVTARPKPCPFKAANDRNCAPLPKLAVFPSPEPLSAEERVLVAVATRGSDAQRQAVLTASKPRSDAPLAIADLAIPPLAALDEGTK